MRIVRGASRALVLLLLLSGTAHAAPIYSFSGGTGTSGQNFTYSFDFTPTVAITIDALGYLDDGQDGLLAGHRVGIWTQGGALLTSTTVTTANSTLSGGVVNGAQFRYTPIADLSLLAGVTYRLGAAVEGAADVFYFGGTNIAASPYATVSSVGYFTQGNFLFPSSTIANTYHIVNLQASPTQAAEPASLLLLGTGLIGAGVRRWRQKRA